MRGIDDFYMIEFQDSGYCRCFDLASRANQNGDDKILVCCLQCAGKRQCVTGMDNCGANRGKLTSGFYQRLVSSTARMKMHFWQSDPWTADFLGRCYNLCLTFNNQFSRLVDAFAVKHKMFILCYFFANLDPNGHCVPKRHRTEKVQCLAQIDRAWPGQFCAEYGGDERATPHAVRGDAVKLIVLGGLFDNMDRVRISRHRSE